MSSVDDDVVETNHDGVVTVMEGIPLYLNEGWGSNRYKGVHKHGPADFQVKLWVPSPRPGYHHVVGFYTDEESAALAYAKAKNSLRPDGTLPPQSVATTFRATDGDDSGQPSACQKTPGCVRHFRHPGHCSVRGNKRTKRASSSREADAPVDPASVQRPRRTANPPRSATTARSDGGAAAPSAATFAAPSAASSTASSAAPSSGAHSSSEALPAPNSASASTHNSDGKFVVESLKELNRQLHNGEITSDAHKQMCKQIRQYAVMS